MFDLKKDGATLWAGDDATLAWALKMEQSCIAKMEAGYTPGARDPSAENLPRMYERSGNVGVIRIRGSLINTENMYTAFFDMSTYPAIREALVFAASDPKVDKILLDIESGGGAVSGVHDTARLIGEVNQLKPVTAFTGDLAASAAYWLASSAGEFYADDTAIVGSIGVITTHTSVSAALKSQGLDVTVMRAGENKMLGHPAEPLSDKARAQIQGQLDSAYDFFTGAVAKNTGLPLAERDDWANGNIFFAPEAEKVGLISGVASYDQTFSKLAVDKTKAVSNTQSNNKRADVKTPNKATLTTEQLAAIAAGIASDTAAQAAATAAAAATEATGATEAQAVAAAAEAAAATAAAEVAAAEAATAAAAAAASTGNEIVAFLQGELKAAQASVVALTVEKTALTAKVTDFEASHTALCDIVRKGINVMAIALNGSEGNLANLTGMELVAKHKALAEDFTSKFTVGGVAATDTTAEKINAEVIPIDHKARVQAVALSRKK